MDRIRTVTRTSILDSVLITAAVATILLALAPRQVDRQVVAIRAAGGERLVAFPVDDPALAKLRLAFERRRVREPLRLFALHRWLAETADHYAKTTRRTHSANSLTGGERVDEELGSVAVRSANQRKSQRSFAERTATMKDSKPESKRQPGAAVIPVAHRTSSPSQRESQADAESRLTPPAERWKLAGQQNRAVLAEIRRRTSEAMAGSAAPPIVVKDTRRGPIERRAWSALLIVSPLVFALHWLWCALLPPRRSPTLAVDQAECVPGAPGVHLSNNLDDAALAFRLPADWVRIRQPPSVRIRKAVLVVTGLAAVSVAPTLWFG